MSSSAQVNKADSFADCKACDATDNKYFSCLPKMSDGRHFTDYRPSCVTHSRMMFALPRKNKDGLDIPPANNHDFRQYLIHNAEKLRQKQISDSYWAHMYTPAKDSYSLVSVPEQTKLKCDRNACHVTLNDPNGVGQGRNYEEEKGPTHFNYIRQRLGPRECCTINPNHLGLSTLYDQNMDSLDHISDFMPV